MKKPQNQALMQNIFLYLLGEQSDVTTLASEYAVALGRPRDQGRFENEVVPIHDRLNN